MKYRRPQTSQKTSTSKSKSQPQPQHGTQIVFGLNYDELIEKVKGFLVDQLLLRKVPLTTTDKQTLSRDKLASLIIVADTDYTKHVSTKLIKKLSKRQALP